MTAPVTPEALVEALAKTIHLSLHPGGNFEMARAGQSPGWMAADSLAEAIAADIIAPALKQVTAERDGAREVVARCNNSFGSYSYHLNPHPAEQIEKVKWQARSEWQRAEEATAEAASLRAEAEAKDRARDDALKAAIRAWSAKLHIPVTRMMSRELRAEFSAALARAATAGEGRSDPPALDDRDFCECRIGQCRALTERCREDADGQPR